MTIEASLRRALRIRVGRLVDGTDAPVLEDAALLVVDDRIADIGPDDAVARPADARELHLPEFDGPAGPDGRPRPRRPAADHRPAGDHGRRDRRGPRRARHGRRRAHGPGGDHDRVRLRRPGDDRLRHPGCDRARPVGRSAAHGQRPAGDPAAGPLPLLRGRGGRGRRRPRGGPPAHRGRGRRRHQDHGHRRRLDARDGFPARVVLDRRAGGRGRRGAPARQADHLARPWRAWHRQRLEGRHRFDPALHDARAELGMGIRRDRGPGHGRARHARRPDVLGGHALRGRERQRHQQAAAEPRRHDPQGLVGQRPGTARCRGDDRRRARTSGSTSPTSAKTCSSSSRRMSGSASAPRRSSGWPPPGRPGTSASRARPARSDAGLAADVLVVDGAPDRDITDLRRTRLVLRAGQRIQPTPPRPKPTRGADGIPA